MSTTSTDDDKWRKFFQIYKNLPELWEVKNEAYKNRRKRIKGYEKLFVAYKAIDKNATLEGLKARLSNIRTCYRREVKKIRHSLLYSEEVHEPTLWYFHYLDFLRDQEQEHSDAKNQMDFAEESICNNDTVVVRKDSGIDKNFLIKKAIIQLDKLSKSGTVKDEADIYADSWSCSFRKLSHTQQIYAKKAIEEVLIMGQLNALTYNTIDTGSMGSIDGAESPTPDIDIDDGENLAEDGQDPLVNCSQIIDKWYE